MKVEITTAPGIFAEGVVNTPPPKGGGFELRLKAGLVRLWRTQVTLKSSSGSGGVWFLIYSAHTSSVTLPLLVTQ